MAPRNVHVRVDDDDLLLDSTAFMSSWTTLARACPLAQRGPHSLHLGLTRVSVGVTSGDPVVRSFYHQAWTDEDLRRAFADLKAAGIGASVLTLVAAGGLEHADSHVRANGRTHLVARPESRRFRLPAG